MKAPNRYNKKKDHIRYGLQNWVLSNASFLRNSNGGIKQLEFDDLIERFALYKGMVMKKNKDRERLASDNFNEFTKFVNDGN